MPKYNLQQWSLNKLMANKNRISVQPNLGLLRNLGSKKGNMAKKGRKKNSGKKT